MIVAGEECKKLIKMDKRILRARHDAIREVLDALYKAIIRLQAESGQNYSDVLDIIYEYRRAFLGESAKSRTKFPASEIDWMDDTGTREFIEYQRRRAIGNYTANLPLSLNGTGYYNTLVFKGGKENCVCPHPGHLCEDCHGRR